VKELLLAHGWGGDRTVWEAIEPHLAPHFRLAAFDLRGFGTTEGSLAEARNHKLNGLVQELSERVEAAGGPRVIAVGSSFSATAVLALAQNPPGNLAAAVAIGGSPRWSPAPDWEYGPDVDSRKTIFEKLRAGYLSTIEELVPAYEFNDGDRQAAEEAFRKLLGIARRVQNPEIPITILERTFDYDIRASVANVRRPVLLVHGDKDLVTPPAVGRWMVDRIPGARLVIVPGAGHFPYMTYPSAVAEAIIRFAAETTT
jgi:pimeloyl-ACP methyl ester carboxylesterase